MAYGSGTASVGKTPVLTLTLNGAAPAAEDGCFNLLSCKSAQMDFHPPNGDRRWTDDVNPGLPDHPCKGKPLRFCVRILSQKLCDQPFFFFQLVDAPVNFSTAVVIQRHVLNNLPCVTHSTNGE